MQLTAFTVFTFFVQCYCFFGVSHLLILMALLPTPRWAACAKSEASQLQPCSHQQEAGKEHPGHNRLHQHGIATTGWNTKVQALRSISSRGLQAS